ncbi:hypothetical protein [Paenibacillus flagellatus]|uniref:Uncharacterized protein n=1 Tax=Paenibacillus flagellatus TaxID=2211139 RepID=A0A2V5K9L0_9BACL|nr:hypothetical protein [Paenibacillus flagellatus]PYI54603.1 hypothetical protein DLM86_14195 [Paenibacillus flagellatus]
MLAYGVEMRLPEGKRPGYYAQFVKALAAKARLADRDKEMLITGDEANREAVKRLLEEYRFEYEEFDLLALPETAETTPLFDDYGFVSVSERAYLYARLCAVFRFADAESPEARANATAQMEEHLIARFADGNETSYAVDRTLAELMHGIAKAYRCRVEFVYGE